MTPTLEVGDRLMVYKLAFTLGDVDRGRSSRVQQAREHGCRRRKNFREESYRPGG